MGSLSFSNFVLPTFRQKLTIQNVTNPQTIGDIDTADKDILESKREKEIFEKGKVNQKKIRRKLKVGHANHKIKNNHHKTKTRHIRTKPREVQRIIKDYKEKVEKFKTF